MARDFTKNNTGVSGPWKIVFSITPSVNDLPYVSRGVYIGGNSGALAVETLDGTQVTVDVVQGTLYPAIVRKVLPATTATGLSGGN